MSRSIDLFIDGDRTIEEMAQEIEKLTNYPVTPGDVPGTWSLTAGDVQAELHPHPYVDDGDLLLEQFRFALSARVGHDVRVVDAPQTALLRMVSEILRRADIPTLLVHDLQYRDRGGRPPAQVPEAAPEGGGE